MDITSSSRWRNVCSSSSRMAKFPSRNDKIYAVELLNKRHAERDDSEEVGRSKRPRIEYVLIMNNANCG